MELKKMVSCQRWKKTQEPKLYANSDIRGSIIYLGSLQQHLIDAKFVNFGETGRLDVIKSSLSSPPSLMKLSVGASCTDADCESRQRSWGLNNYINLSSGRIWLKWFPVSYTPPCFGLIPGWARRHCGGTTEDSLARRRRRHGGPLVARSLQK